jgi:hypothetical protein
LAGVQLVEISSRSHLHCIGVADWGLAWLARVLDQQNTNSLADRWLTRAWQTDDGLPDNNVSGVTQTSDGDLWVAILGGSHLTCSFRFADLATEKSAQNALESDG